MAYRLAHPPHYLGGSFGYWRTTKTSGTNSMKSALWRSKTQPSNGGIGRNNALNSALHGKNRSTLNVVLVGIWINFKGHWLAAQALSFSADRKQKLAHAAR